jgi:hypothetical protein
MWTDIRWLTRFEFKSNVFSLLGTICFFMFYALLLGLMTQDILRDLSVASIAMDAFFIAATPGLGLLFKRDYFSSYWSTDIFSKRLRYWRQLPIHIRDIVWSKYLHLLLCTLIQAPIFFILFYVTSQYQEVYIHWLSFIAFAYAWTVFGMAGAMAYLYMELTFSGKRYFILSMLSIIPILLLLFILNAIGAPIVITSFYWASYGYGLPMALAATVALAAIWSFFPRATIQKLSTRDW